MSVMKGGIVLPHTISIRNEERAHPLFASGESRDALHPLVQLIIEVTMLLGKHIFRMQSLILC